jgi:hypothetical protein
MEYASYAPKNPLFAICGQTSSLLDPTTPNIYEKVAALLRGILNRHRCRHSFSVNIPRPDA